MLHRNAKLDRMSTSAIYDTGLTSQHDFQDQYLGSTPMLSASCTQMSSTPLNPILAGFCSNKHAFCGRAQVHNSSVM